MPPLPVSPSLARIEEWRRKACLLDQSSDALLPTLARTFDALAAFSNRRRDPKPALRALASLHHERLLALEFDPSRDAVRDLTDGVLECLQLVLTETVQAEAADRENEEGAPPNEELVESALDEVVPVEPSIELMHTEDAIDEEAKDLEDTVKLEATETPAIDQSTPPVTVPHEQEPTERSFIDASTPSDTVLEQENVVSVQMVVDAVEKLDMEQHVQKGYDDFMTDLPDLEEVFSENELGEIASAGLAASAAAASDADTADAGCVQPDDGKKKKTRNNKKKKRMQKHAAAAGVGSEDTRQHAAGADWYRWEPAVDLPAPFVTKFATVDAPAKPRNFFSDIAWEGYEELAEDIAEYVVDGFDAYTTGCLDKCSRGRSHGKMSMMLQLNAGQHEYTRDQRNRVVSHAIWEALKQRDFFCCILCHKTFFNYKQLLVHQHSRDHDLKETRKFRNTFLNDVRNVIGFITRTPNNWSLKDEAMESGCRVVYGIVPPANARPLALFARAWRAKHAALACPVSAPAKATPRPRRRFRQAFGLSDDSSSDEEEDWEAAAEEGSLAADTRKAVLRAKSAAGCAAMVEMHEHIGEGVMTHCSICGNNTGDREDFYAHLVSANHVEKDGARFDLLTMLVNLYRRDLV